MQAEYNLVSGEPKSNVLSSTFTRCHWQSAGTKYRELVCLKAQVNAYERIKRGHIFVPYDKIEC